jgi:hypothetical protein
MARTDRSGVWRSTQNKQKTRNRVIAVFGKRKPRVSLLMPGVDIMCLKGIFDAGHIHKGMKFIIVERFPHVMDEIKAQISAISTTLYKQCTFHQGELHDLELKTKVDFAFIDLLGNLTKDLFNWFRSAYLPATSPKAVTFLTLQRGYRGNTFMRSWRHYVWRVNAELKDIFFKHKCQQKLAHKGIAQSFYKKSVPYTLWLLDGLFAEHGIKFGYRKIFAYKDDKGEGSKGVGMIFMQINQYKKKCPLMMPDISTIDFVKIEEDYKALRDSAKIAKPPKEEILWQIKKVKDKMAGQKAALTRMLTHGTKGSREEYQIAIETLKKEMARLEKLL